MQLALFYRVHGRERFVLDGNRLNSLSKLVTVRMRQKQNRLFGVIHGLGGQARLIVQNQSDAVFPRNVFGGDNNILVPGNGRVKIDLFNFATGNCAAHGCAVKHAGQNHVVDIARRSGDFVPAFFARHRGPNDVTDGHKFLLWRYSV